MQNLCELEKELPIKSNVRCWWDVKWHLTLTVQQKAQPAL